MAGGITSLPNELLEKIADETTNADLLNLRLTCRQLNEKTLRTVGKRFFQWRLVFIYIKRSIDQLVEISRHQTFRSYVRNVDLASHCLRYDEDTVHWKGLRRQYGEDLECNIDSDVFLQYWKDQQWLTTTGSNIRLMADALAKFPDLVQLSTVHPCEHQLRQLRLIAGDILPELDDPIQNSEADDLSETSVPSTGQRNNDIKPLETEDDMEDESDIDFTKLKMPVGEHDFIDFEFDDDSDCDDSDCDDSDCEGDEDESLGETDRDWDIKTEWPLLFKDGAMTHPSRTARFVVALLIASKARIKNLLVNFEKFFGCEALSVSTEDRHLLQDQLRSLQHLSMRATIDMESEALVQMLQSATNLKELGLWLFNTPSVGYFNNIVSKTKFQKLVTLRLWNCYESRPFGCRAAFYEPSTIIQFLSNSKLTLRDVELVDLAIKGSFIPCLQYMHGAMRLQTLTLHGIDEHLYDQPESEYGKSHVCPELECISLSKNVKSELRKLIKRLRASCGTRY
ncbi:hypothetical protein NA57DRAFT_51346 [Rhizodiscina lignyota]|uniref:F-box domain-containing protein n=1 Tax=Rhizodiscina lignyota TaxID=1504668 RepID=A0A9P4IN15_9PEZI|nr:hypothetical protein NA57DRAFT_51346 [Rhizodiscina lignyota]